MKAVRELALLALLTASCSLASAAMLPDLLCQEAKSVRVDPRSLAAQEREARVVYRFKAGSVYMSGPDRPESLYAKAVEVAPLRFNVGHKVFHFEPRGPEYRVAIVVHLDPDEVRVSRIFCQR